jgi:hypothetical protein
LCAGGRHHTTCGDLVNFLIANRFGLSLTVSCQVKTDAQPYKGEDSEEDRGSPVAEVRMGGDLWTPPARMGPRSLLHRVGVPGAMFEHGWAVRDQSRMILVTPSSIRHPVFDVLQYQARPVTPCADR